jgi:protease I
MAARAAGYNREMSVAGKRVALLVEEGFEDSEVFGPLQGLREAGAVVTLVAPLAGRDYTGKRGQTLTSDAAAGKIRESDVDAVVIPGGYAPDRMRLRHAMVDLVRDAFAAGKPVAAICHGPQLLISADVLRGRTVTCWPSIAIDVRNAGGLYVDRPVVRDGNLITSRKPDDVPQFTAALLHALET